MHVSRLLLPTFWPFSKSTTATGESKPDPEGVATTDDRIERLVMALPDPVLVVAAGGKVVAANAHVRAALDADPLGHHLSATIRAPALLEAVNAAVEGAEAHRVELEMRVPLARSFDVHVAPLGGAALLVFRDLTREQQIERMRADFVANASHELRTPLASLSGFIETMQGAARNDEAARTRFLTLMRQQADRMRRLIDDLLSLSRIEINEHVRPTGTADLAQIASMVRDNLDGVARELDCEIVLQLQGPLPVIGDGDELLQVVQNLVENALKYGSSGKRIEIEGGPLNGHMELTVRDHGPGIAAEHLPRLTERFYRVSVLESRMRGGTGLGLAIVKHILNRHRGRLSIASEPGQGSAFTIRLPAAK
jgi:two-component system phosphate regulon sensor histidine kinase PhoR